MRNDPLKDVRDVRRKISSECGDDPDRIFAFYRRHQSETKRSGQFQFVNSRVENIHTVPATERGDHQPGTP